MKRDNRYYPKSVIREPECFESGINPQLGLHEVSVGASDT